MNLRLIVTLLLVSNGFSGDCWAWGDQGHKVICEIAFRLAQPSTRTEIKKLISSDDRFTSFSDACTYEHGTNRISSSRLYEFAKVLDVPVSYFFDEMPSNALSGRPMSGRGRNGYGEAGTPFEKEKDPLIKRETLELVRAYDKIDEERVRYSIFATVKALGEASHAKLFASRRQR